MNGGRARCFLVLGCAASCFLMLGCAGSIVPAPTSTESIAPGDPGIDLPAGVGRAVLERSCTNCHDLAGLAAYKGYYDREKWRALVDTMVAHGAGLDEAEVTLVTDYLVEYFGPGAL